MKSLILGFLFFHVSSSVYASCESNVAAMVSSSSSACMSYGACSSGGSVGDPSVRVYATKDTLYVMCDLKYCGTSQATSNMMMIQGLCSPNVAPIAVKNVFSTFWPAEKCGSVVHVENQVVGESVPIVGASFSMNYFSNWSLGRIGDYKIKIPLSGSAPRDDINSFDVNLKMDNVTLASASYLNDQPNINFSYLWDGLVSGAPTLGSKNINVTVTEHHTSIDIPVTSTVTVGSFQAKNIGLGGWVPSIYHYYDRNTKILYSGNGTTKIVEVKQYGTSGFYSVEDDASLVYYFDGTGRHLFTKTGLTGAIIYTFNYDLSGRLASISEPFSSATSFNRNLSGEFASITSPKGQVTNVTTDSNGFVIAFTNPNNESYQMTYYGNNGLLATFKKPGLQTTTLTYDADGNLSNDSHSGGYFFDLLKIYNDGNSYQYKTTTSMSRVTTFQGSSDVTYINRTTTHPEGRQDIYSYTKNSSSASETNSSNGVNSTAYYTLDARFGPLSLFKNSQNYYAGPVSFNVSRAQNVTLNDPNDPFSISAMSLTSTKGSLVLTTSYDPTTKTFSSSTSLGRSTELKIDSYERVASNKKGNLTPVEFTYSNEKLSLVSQGTRATQLAYNTTSGLLETITNPLNQTIGFVYNSAGRLIGKVLPDSRAISYLYDSNGNTSGITPPGRSAHYFYINNAELLSSYAPPVLNGASVVNTSYFYNLDKQLTQVTRPDGAVVYFDYDSLNGSLMGITTPAGTYSFTLNSQNGLPSYIYSPNGSITQVMYVGTRTAAVTNYNSSWSNLGTYSPTFLSSALLGSDNVSGPLGVDTTIYYSYDDDEYLIAAGDLGLSYNTPNGQLTGTTMGSGTTEFTDSYSYNTYGEVTGYQAKRGTTVLYDLTLTRDGAGRVSEKSQTMNAITNAFTYGFDLSGRLQQVLKNSVVVSNYGYDSNSNRNSGNVGAQATNATYDDQDRLLTYNTLSFTYNANGEMLTRMNATIATTTQYTYDVFGNLIQVVLPGGSTTITYEIDGLNRRIGKKVNGVLQKRWVYRDQYRIAAELDASGGITKRFVYGSKGNIPDYIIASGVKYRIISDHLGSPRLVVKQSDGTITQRMDHDEFGRVTEDTNPGYLPFGFAAGLYDHQTGLVRFGARDYDPETARWMSKDPILFEGGDTNLYGYTFNDPVNFIDPTGLAVGDWWDLPANYGRSREIANEEYANWAGHHNDAGDAMRHYEWSRRTTAETNSFTAFTAGWGHEVESFFRRGTMPASQYLRESWMDVHNNALGRDSGRNGSLMCPSNLSTQPGSGGY